MAPEEEELFVAEAEVTMVKLEDKGVVGVTSGLMIDVEFVLFETELDEVGFA